MAPEGLYSEGQGVAVAQDQAELVSMNKRQYMSKAASLGCMLCRTIGFPGTPAQLHHPRAGRGMGQRAQGWLVIPLCEQHHTGPTGIHGDRSAWKNAGVDEMDLLAETIRLIFLEI